LEIIENIDEWRGRFADWKRPADQNVIDSSYPLVRNKRAPFSPARRALTMLNLVLISSAGAYIDGTEGFDTSAADGDFTFREIPIEVEARDLRFAARGYDTAAVLQDLNSQIPIQRLLEYEQNGVIGQLNPIFLSCNGFMPNAARVVDELLPTLLERILRYEVQAALLVPASRLCHQSVSLIARRIELAGIPTMTLAVDKEIIESVRPPRAGLHSAQPGSVAGASGWPEHQRRVLDQALRLIEPMDSPGFCKLDVDIESAVEKERGER